MKHLDILSVMGSHGQSHLYEVQEGEVTPGRIPWSHFHAEEIWLKWSSGIGMSSLPVCWEEGREKGDGECEEVDGMWVCFDASEKNKKRKKSARQPKLAFAMSTM